MRVAGVFGYRGSLGGDFLLLHLCVFDGGDFGWRDAISGHAHVRRNIPEL